MTLRLRGKARDAMTDILTASSRPLTPPRAAAVAGIIFSALMITSLGIVRMAVPADPAKPGLWLTDSTGRNAVRLALNLVPFAGVAFLWFMGVLRNRVGALEDKFFATVLLGSGLLFVGSLFASAAAAGALVETAPAGNIQQANNEIYYFVRRMSYAFLNVFAIKMAGVFMFSTCTIALRTAIFPRWVAFSGFVCGVALLVIISNWLWIGLLFPLWILLVSAQILVADRMQSR
jgi:hypothetical protein